MSMAHGCRLSMEISLMKSYHHALSTSVSANTDLLVHEFYRLFATFKFCAQQLLKYFFLQEETAVENECKSFKNIHFQDPLPRLRPLYIACSTYYGWTTTDKTSTIIM